MSTDDVVNVTPADLVSHAGHLDGIASQVAAAHQAGDTVRLEAEAYGRLCVIVPVLVESLQRIVLGGIDAAVHSLRDTGERLRTAAETYRMVDEHSAEALDQARPTP